MTWLTPQVIITAVVGITILVTFIWKVATKNNVKSLKADTERDIQSLKADTERDIQSLKSDTERDMKTLKADLEDDILSLKTEIKDYRSNNREDLRQVRQDFTNHLNGHPAPSSTKNETRHEGLSPESFEEYNKSLKGEFTADEPDNRTRS